MGRQLLPRLGQNYIHDVQRARRIGFPNRNSLWLFSRSREFEYAVRWGTAPRSIAARELTLRHATGMSYPTGVGPDQLVELTGIEPVTSCLQSRRSPN